MKTLVTGVAGFIGFHTANRLLDRGGEVVGIDCVNDYYSVELKNARLEKLEARDGFRFHKLDLSDRQAYDETRDAIAGVSRTIHLAAQAGVRYSIENPRAYARSNLVGHLNLPQLARVFRS